MQVARQAGRRRYTYIYIERGGYGDGVYDGDTGADEDGGGNGVGGGGTGDGGEDDKYYAYHDVNHDNGYHNDYNDNDVD